MPQAQRARKDGARRGAGRDWVDQLIDELRARAKAYAEDGAEMHTRLYGRLAETIEQRREAWLDEPLTLAQAAAESGYDDSSLRRWRDEGRVPSTDDGRVLRRYLPRKPGHGVPDDLRGPHRIRLVADDTTQRAVNDLASDILGDAR